VRKVQGRGIRYRGLRLSVKDGKLSKLGGEGIQAVRTEVSRALSEIQCSCWLMKYCG
jgi:hypothetical protein